MLSFKNFFEVLKVLDKHGIRISDWSKDKVEIWGQGVKKWIDFETAQALINWLQDGGDVEEFFANFK